jgi:MFS family permease
MIRGARAAWVAALAITGLYTLSTLPTPLYVIYRETFGFSQITLTLVYATYVLGTVGCMLFLGRLSDQIGRRPVVLSSFGLGIIAAVVFVFARSLPWLYAGRILTGCAIALVSGAGVAWIGEARPERDKQRATQMAIGANFFGLGLGPLIAGLLAQFAPAPLRLCYLIFIVLMIPVAVVVFRSEGTVEQPKPLTESEIGPRLGVPHEIRKKFISPAITAFAAFAVLGFYTALIPSVLDQSLHDKNHATAGAIVAELYFAGVIVIAMTPALDRARGLLYGLWLMLPGTALLVISQARHSLAVLIVGTALTGIATGLAYRFSLQAVHEIAPEDRQSEVISSYLIVCYAAISVPVIGVGVLAHATSLMLADAVFGSVVALLTIVALVMEFRLRPSAKKSSRRAA